MDSESVKEKQSTLYHWEIIGFYSGVKVCDSIDPLTMKTDWTLTKDELSQVGRHWAGQLDDFKQKKHWTEISAVKARINEKTTGNSNQELFCYVIQKYFKDAGRKLEACLSLGSGGGDLERGLIQYVMPKVHVGIEISEDLIKLARKEAAGLPHIRYRQDDLNTCDLGEAEYDLVIAHQSVHHVLNLEGLFRRIKGCMRPEGIFVLDEYMGPRRFQWSDRQLQCINGLIEILPASFNMNVETGVQREKVIRCTPEEVAKVDPSEAIRSDDIVPLIRQSFRVEEYKPYGGTILHMLLAFTAGNFMKEEANPWLNMLFEVEDLLLPELVSDFAAMMCTLPQA